MQTTTTNEMSPEAIALVVETSLAAHFERSRSTPAPHPTVYASARRECDRRMYYELTMPDAQQPPTTELLAKFDRANQRERDLSILLQRAGREADPSFTVVEQQRRAVIDGRNGRPVITGKVDLFLKFANGISVPAEIKTYSQYISDRLKSADDLVENKYTRSSVYQLLAYLFATAQPIGLFIIDRAGMPLLLPLVLFHHLDRCEAFVSQAERVVAAVDAKVPPPYIDDAEECGRCPFFGSTCNPPLNYPGARVLTDPELEALLDRRESLRRAGEEYERIDRDVKAKLRGVELGVAGAYAITGKWSKSSRVELPDDIRKQYTKTDERGRFTLSIVKMTSGTTKEATDEGAD